MNGSVQHTMRPGELLVTTYACSACVAVTKNAAGALLEYMPAPRRRRGRAISKATQRKLLCRWRCLRCGVRVAMADPGPTITLLQYTLQQAEVRGDDFYDTVTARGRP